MVLTSVRHQVQGEETSSAHLSYVKSAQKTGVRVDLHNSESDQCMWSCWMMLGYSNPILQVAEVETKHIV